MGIVGIMSKKVCFIGHRRIGQLGLKDDLKNAVLQEIKSGCRFFTMGTHGSFDELALSVCRELRKDYPDIEIEVVITSYNKVKHRIECDPIFGTEIYTPYSDVKTVMYNIEDTHFKRQIIESNHQMIDSCDTLICYVNPDEFQSGAVYAYKYAKKQDKEIINLYNEKSH